MSRLMDLYLHQNLYQRSMADRFTFLPLMASCAHDQKDCLEIRFRTSLAIQIFIHRSIRLSNKSDLPGDVNFLVEKKSAPTPSIYAAAMI